MTLLRGLSRRASIESPLVPISSESVLEYIGQQNKVDANVTVNQDTAMGMSAVWRALSLISNLGAAMPLHTYFVDSVQRAPSALLEDVHPEMTNFEFWRLAYMHRGAWGNSYAQKVRNNAGQLKWLYPIRPERVKVARVAPTNDNPSGKFFEVEADDGQRNIYTTETIFHIPGLGYDGVVGASPIQVAKQAIGLGLAMEKYGAKFFGSGSMMSGILQVDQRLEQKDADELRQKWRDKTAGLERAHEIPVLDSGASFHQLTIPNEDSQFLESRRFSVTEIGRFYGIPPFLMLETEKSTSWGTGLEQQALGFVKFDFHPAWLAPTEQRVTKELVLARRYAKYSVEGLLRGDSKGRSEFYRVMREVGGFSANDIRRLEDEPPLGPEGDVYLQPMNFVPLGTDPTDLPAPAAPANDSGDDESDDSDGDDDE